MMSAQNGRYNRQEQAADQENSHNMPPVTNAKVYVANMPPSCNEQ
jgi:hypothetical protein